MSATFPEDLKEEELMINFYVRPCHSEKFVGKLDFIKGGWVGPDVFVSE